MKTALCEICAVTDSLCSGCGKRLADGEITQTEIAVSRFLHARKGEFPLDKAEVGRCFDCGTIAYLTTPGDPGVLIGKGGRVVNALKKELGKHVRVITLPTDARKAAEEVLLPAKPLGANVVFHGGAELVKVRVGRSEAARLPARKEELERVLNALLGKQVAISFE